MNGQFIHYKMKSDSEHGGYVPKKGDIVEIDYYDMRPENNKIAEIIEVTDIKHSTPFITLRFSDNDKYRCQRKEIKPLGLSLDRIKERDEKLINALVAEYKGGVIFNKEHYNKMISGIRKHFEEVFAKVDKQ